MDPSPTRFLPAHWSWKSCHSLWRPSSWRLPAVHWPDTINNQLSKFFVGAQYPPCFVASSNPVGTNCILMVLEDFMNLNTLKVKGHNYNSVNYNVATANTYITKRCRRIEMKVAFVSKDCSSSGSRKKLRRYTMQYHWESTLCSRKWMLAWLVWGHLQC